VGAGRAKRSVALRSAFAPSASGVHVAPWGCLGESVVALVSPTGRDDPRRGVAQAACATRLATTLTRSAREEDGTFARAFEEADRSVAELGISTSTAAATAVAIALEGGRLRTALVGGDRVYRIAGGRVDRLTDDRSIADDALREKGADRDSNPDLYDGMPMHLKTSLTCVLGTGKGRADVREHELSPDAWVVMVSHDVALALGEVALKKMLATPVATPGALAEGLVASAYRQRPGGFAAAAVLGPARP
jgi:serine/threonine protein phosphatase PrpC